ncbi:hypothetical protein NAT51_13635 [Flavobacterium amniphilum]|uniref:hypothetical protein n=1 Tax=Flavobacterium amniphilum TaxID=1834035 RepID=UPI00202A1550|nr:hypothetical protein [Flavobacterium amniphilum]MCL9806572.1 hypothetical protein [Flavobacterium amniphilum]
MSTPFKCILMLLSLLFLGFYKPEKRTVYTGTVTIDPKYKDEIAYLNIEFRDHKKAVAGNMLQQDCSFRITTKANKELDIYYTGMGIGDTYLQTVKPTDKDSVFLSFKIPKEYQKKAGKAICPKCNKQDKTITIAYGFKSIVIYAENQPPYTTYEGYGKEEVYDGGCNSSEISAKFFCKRDAIKF